MYIRTAMNEAQHICRWQHHIAGWESWIPKFYGMNFWNEMGIHHSVCNITPLLNYETKQGQQYRRIWREIKMSASKLSTFLSHPSGPLITTLTSSQSPHSTRGRTLNFLLVVKCRKRPQPAVSFFRNSLRALLLLAHPIILLRIYWRQSVKYFIFSLISSRG